MTILRNTLLLLLLLGNGQDSIKGVQAFLLRPLPSRHNLLADRTSVTTLPSSQIFIRTSPLFYRNRTEEEEALTPLSSSVPSRPSSSIPSLGFPTPSFASEPKQQQSSPKALLPSTKSTNSGIQTWMIQSLCLSQIIVLAISSVLFTVLCSSQLDAFLSLLHVDGWTTLVAAALATAAPMIAIAHTLDHASFRAAHLVHFATTNMVLTLFGRRRRRRKSSVENEVQPSQASVRTTTTTPVTTTTLQVLQSSLKLTALTAISEEVVFRGYLPLAIASLVGYLGNLAASSTAPMVVGAVVASLCFGAGHHHPRSTTEENRLVVGLQMFNGLWYTGICALTHSLWPCIVAHFLYDMHILMQTWHFVNHQADYVERAYQEPLSMTQQAALDEIQKESGYALTTETLAFCRRFFYAFDSQHQERLTLADVQRAMTYAFLQEAQKPTKEQVSEVFHKALAEKEQDSTTTTAKGDESLELDQFLRLLFTLRVQMLAQAREQASATTTDTTTTLKEATL